MKSKRASLFTTMLLVLSLALSPVSVFAEEVDKPVNEGPIDEIVYDDGATGRSYTLYYEDPVYHTNLPLKFSTYIYYTVSWTEGISGQVLSAYYVMYNVTIDNVSFTPVHNNVYYYGSSGISGTAYEEFTIHGPNGADIIVRVQIWCNEYGEISQSASIRSIT